MRKNRLIEAAIEIFNNDFRDRVLSFDGDAAHAYADISAQRKKMGPPISQFDAQIAGVARAHGASLSTRNEKDFAKCGINVINPFKRT